MKDCSAQHCFCLHRSSHRMAPKLRPTGRVPATEYPDTIGALWSTKTMLWMVCFFSEQSIEKGLTSGFWTATVRFNCHEHRVDTC